MLPVVFGKFYRQIKKHNDDVIMMPFHVLRFENLRFVKQDIGYHVAKFQIS